MFENRKIIFDLETFDFGTFKYGIKDIKLQHGKYFLYLWGFSQEGNMLSNSFIFVVPKSFSESDYEDLVVNLYLNIIKKVFSYKNLSKYFDENALEYNKAFFICFFEK
jgi:hypothetical protein